MSDVLITDAILLGSKPEVHLDELPNEGQVQKCSIDCAGRKVKGNVLEAERLVVFVIQVAVFPWSKEKPVADDQKVRHCTPKGCRLQFVDNMREESQGDGLDTLR